MTGRGFVDGCDDGGEGPSGFGCSGGEDGESDAPLEDDELGWVTWTFTVPETLSPGPAVLKTDGSEPLRVRIVPSVIVDERSQPS